MRPRHVASSLAEGHTRERLFPVSGWLTGSVYRGQQGGKSAFQGLLSTQAWLCGDVGFALLNGAMSPSGCGSSKWGFLQTVLGTAHLRKGSAHRYEPVFPRKLVFKLEVGAVMLGAPC